MAAGSPVISNRPRIVFCRSLPFGTKAWCHGISHFWARKVLTASRVSRSATLRMVKSSPRACGRPRGGVASPGCRARTTCPRSRSRRSGPRSRSSQTSPSSPKASEAETTEGDFQPRSDCRGRRGAGPARRSGTLRGRSRDAGTAAPGPLCARRRRQAGARRRETPPASTGPGAASRRPERTPASSRPECRRGTRGA